MAQTVKVSGYNAGDLGSIPGSGRSPGKGNGNSFQESWLENPINRGAWWATVHGAASVRHDLATKLPPSFIYVYFCPHHGVCGILSPGGMHDLITPTGIEPLTSAVEASLCFPICLSLLKLASIESVMLSNHLILCYSLLLLPSVFPSIRIFSDELLLASGRQSIGTSTSVLPMNIQG